MVIWKHSYNKLIPVEELVVRNLSWSADEVDLQPRPANFADAEPTSHFAMQADVVLAAFGL